MRNYKFRVEVFGGGSSFAKVRTINRVQAEALVAQEFPDRTEVVEIKRLPKNEEWALEI